MEGGVGSFDAAPVANYTQMELLKLINDLAKKDICIQLSTGYSDAINGYGWHPVYFLKAIKIIDYCPKCRVNEGVDLNENTTSHKRHAWRKDEVKILSEAYDTEWELIESLKKLSNT